MSIVKNNSKIIFHIDMNAFFCSVACILNPKLRGKAFAIGRVNTTKGVIATASYEARAYGIHSAMSIKEAYDILPTLIIVDIEYNHYLEYHNKFIKIIKEYSDLVEVGSIDEVYVDMTEISYIKHPLVLANEIQVRLLKELSLPCSIGIGPTLFLAKMASDIKKPLGITVIRKRQVKSILYPISVKEIFGIGKKTYPKLVDNGILTIKDFMNIENKNLIISLIGENSYNYVVDSILGNTSNEVIPNRYSNSTSISNTITYDIHLTSLDEILYELRKITRNVVSKLKSGNYFTKNISIILKDSNFKTITRSKTIDEYTDDFLDIYDVVVTLIEDNIENKSYRLIGMGVNNILKKDELPKEYNLFTISDNIDKYENIINIMNHFKNKYGEKSLYFKKEKK